MAAHGQKARTCPNAASPFQNTSDNEWRGKLESRIYDVIKLFVSNLDTQDYQLLDLKIARVTPPQEFFFDPLQSYEVHVTSR